MVIKEKMVLATSSQWRYSKINARKGAEELFLEMKGNKEINVSPDRKFKYFANLILFNDYIHFM